MKNPFASFFRSLLKRFRPSPAVAAVSHRRDGSVAALSSAPSSAGGDTGATTNEQFRKLLIDALDDPAFARRLARRLLVPTFPTAGGQPTFLLARDVCSGSSASDRTFGGATNCNPSGGDFAFPAKLGIGTDSPGATLDVSASTATIRAIGSTNPYIYAQDTTNNLVAKLQALDSFGLVGTETNHDFTVYTNNLERVRFDTSGKVGIGTASPGATLDVSATTATIRAIGSANPYIFAQDTTNNLIAKLQALDTLGLVGTESNHAFAVYTNNIERVRFDTSGKVGIGTTSPQAKLHVKGGGITIEDDMGAGRLGFAETGESSARTVLYRGGRACNATPAGQPDITILRNFPQANASDSCVVWTLMRLWAPSIPSPTPDPLPDREATISLVRELSATDEEKQEFIDIYNNGYVSTGSVQHGIRIQKRNPTGQTAAQYRDFVFEQYDGNASRTKLQIMSLAADRTVRMRSHGDTTDWTGTDSVHATAVLTTTNATQSTLFSLSLENGRAYFLVARVVARQSDGSNRAFYYRAACVFRETSGGTQLQGVQSIATIESSAGLDCTIDIDSASNTARVRVTGLSSATIYWVGTIEYQSVATSS